jgi:hypothetical protein
MKFVYSAANLPDAQLVHDLLQQAGVPAHIFNANASAAIGELPLSAACPQVWIAQGHQEGHARSVIADYLRPGPEPAGKTCSRCAEGSPGQFELCWNCGAVLPAFA